MKMTRFSQTIDDDPNRVILTRCPRQFGDEVHCDLVPFPCGKLSSLILSKSSLRLSSESIGYDIRLTWVITNLTIVITEKLNPSILSHAKFLLGEGVLKTFVIRIHRTLCTVYVVSPKSGSKSHSANTLAGVVDDNLIAGQSSSVR
ncbi:hypothetical protein Tco_0494641 [Tanacetum coccineum]